MIAAGAGSGKSTLLESLLPWYPAADRRIRLRGSFESFAWEQDPRFDPFRSVLVAEEISGHLPSYLWGPAVAHFLSWRDRGCAIVATAHGDSVEDIGRLLTGYPLLLPLGAMTGFDAIVRIGPVEGAPGPRSAVTTIWTVGQTAAGGLLPATLHDGSGCDEQIVSDVLRRIGAEHDQVDSRLSALRTRIEASDEPDP